MAIRKYGPFTPGRRLMTRVLYEGLEMGKKEKKLLSLLPKKSGRSQGSITVRHQGGREKRLFRFIDFKRDKIGVAGTVASVEYDPNRNSLIALINYSDGEKRYILCPLGLKVGDSVVSKDDAEIKLGNSLLLSSIPLGTLVHNIELSPGRGGQVAKSAGTGAVVLAKEGKYAHLRFPSNEVHKVLLSCRASIGQLSNIEHSIIKLGTAGRKRHMGIRPTVRGVAMPAGVHPHGGGEGRTGPGRIPKTIYGKKARRNTRKRNKRTNILIVQKRSR